MRCAGIPAYGIQRVKDITQVPSCRDHDTHAHEGPIGGATNCAGGGASLVKSPRNSIKDLSTMDTEFSSIFIICFK